MRAARQFSSESKHSRQIIRTLAVTDLFKYAEMLATSGRLRQDAIPYEKVKKQKRFFPLQLEKSAVSAEVVKLIHSEIAEGLDGEPSPSIDQVLGIKSVAALAAGGTVFNARQYGIPDEKVSEDILGQILRDSGFHSVWHHYRWDRNGRLLYDLHPEVALALLNTELTCSGKDVIWPSSTLYISVPLELDYTVWNVETGEHRLDGFFVSRCDGFIYICAIGLAHDDEAVGNNGLSTFCFEEGAEDLERYMNETLDDEISKMMAGPNGSRMKDWARLVLNTLLYIENCSDDVHYDSTYGVPSKKMKRAECITSKKQKEKFLGKWRERICYHSIGLRPRQSEGSKQGSGRTLSGQFMVKGHWKHQPYGPGRTKRKLIYIWPYWKGPEDAPILKTTQVVKVRN